MLINFDTILTDITGNPIKEFMPARDDSGKIVWEDEEKKLAKGTFEPVLLRNCAVAALYKTHEVETPPPTIAEQGKRVSLAAKIAKGGDVDLDESERDLIIQLVGHIKEWGTPIAGQIYNILKK